MNQAHLELCSSAEWAEACERWIIPWVVDGIDLGDDVLEIGPGPGRTTDVLVRMVPRLTAVEVDADLAAALAARMAAAGVGQVSVQQGDATDLPFGDDRFTSALSFTMLHHVPSAASQDRVFAEAARVLRAGGLFAGTDSLDSPEFRALHEGDVCVPIDPAGLEGRLLAAGFVSAEVETNEYGVRFRATAGSGAGRT